MEWTPIVDMAYDATITVGTESGQTFTPTIQLKDYAGNDLDVAASIIAYMASDSTGLIPDATITGEVALTSSGDGAVIVLLTHCAYLLVSEAYGDIDLTITDTGTGALYLVLVMPNGKLVVSGAMTFT